MWPMKGEMHMGKTNERMGPYRGHFSKRRLGQGKK